MVRNRVLGLMYCGLLATALYAQEPLATDLAQQVEKIAATIKSDPLAADKAFGELLKGKNKKNISLYIAISEVYLKSGNVPEAKKYSERAMKIDNKSPKACILAGDIALTGKDAGTACGYYEQAILFDESCSEAYYKYAHAYLGVNPQLSVDMLMKLKTAHPEDVNVDRELANAYYEMGNFSQAKSAYDEFMQKGKPGVQDYARYAMLLYLNKDYQKSLDMIAEGLALDKSNHLMKRLKMYDLFELKSYKDGLVAAEEFFADPNNPDYVYLDYMYRGRLFLADENPEAAVAEFEKALKADAKKEHPEIAQELSQAYEQMKKYPEAIQYYQTYLDSQAEDKKDVKEFFLFGRLYYKAASTTEDATAKAEYITKGDEVFGQVAERTPNSYLGSFWRARINVLKDPETEAGLAKPYYEAALAILEKNENAPKAALVECNQYLGYYYFVKKEYEQSKVYWNKILEIDPTNATAKQALDGMK